jgi:hypothetical protein
MPIERYPNGGVLYYGPYTKAEKEELRKMGVFGSPRVFPSLALRPPRKAAAEEPAATPTDSRPSNRSA